MLNFEQEIQTVAESFQDEFLLVKKNLEGNDLNKLRQSVSAAKTEGKK